MMNLRLGRPRAANYQVLCLGAHSDDIEIGCGGTILTLLQQYETVCVHWVVFSGSEERAREARESANCFLAGASDKQIVVKDYRDGFFPFVADRIKDDFELLKRQFDPDLVLTHYRDDRHQDHRVISDLTWNTFRNHLVLEYEIPKWDGDLGQPNLFVPLDEAVCSRKVHMLLQSFRSQAKKQWFDEQTFMAILRLRGLEANAPSRFAEAFYCRKAVLA
jgi:LmbE family N-acetylglucosaminyl deacetylase